MDISEINEYNDIKYNEIIEGHLNISQQLNSSILSGKQDMRMNIVDQRDATMTPTGVTFNSAEKKVKKLDLKVLTESQKNLLKIIKVAQNPKKVDPSFFESQRTSQRGFQNSPLQTRKSTTGSTTPRPSVSQGAVADQNMSYFVSDPLNQKQVKINPKFRKTQVKKIVGSFF